MHTNVKLTTEEFIARARDAHGDKYDYSQTVYNGSKSKVKFICTEHGEIQIRANAHLQGTGCAKCSWRKMGESNKKGLERFILEARKIHGDKYDYSNSVYTGVFAKVQIICPIHGVFEQAPQTHLIGKGCQKCGRVTHSEKKTKTTDQFIAESIKVHGNKYDYSNSVYTGVFAKVRIICPIHGLFEQTARDHLSGSGCTPCGIISQHEKTTHTTEQFIAKAVEIHGNRYDYSRVNYTRHRDKVQIGCKIHGVFEQAPANHLRGNGCQRCKISRGEKFVEEWLQDVRIPYIREYMFANCRNINPLPFDFYLPNENLLIEFDGEQHYHPVEFFGGVETFVITQNNDKIKNNFATSSNIPLLRIKYDIPFTEIPFLLTQFIMENA